MPEALERGREAYDRRAWDDAYRELAKADDGGLDAPDLERLANAAHLTGRYDEHSELLERAHLAYLDDGDVPAAVRCAFWLGMGLVRYGDRARGGGWFARAGRLLEDAPDCAEHGWVLIPAGLRHLGQGEPEAAQEVFRELTRIADRFDEPDLTALSRLGLGQATVAAGDVAAGVSLLDEVMVSVEAGEVSPIPAGIIYCGAIEVCQAIFDLQRAREWTAALSAWCESQPDLVPYRGQCLVHRAEVLQLHGDWRQALEEARQASTRLEEGRVDPAAGSARYRQAELHRVRGEFDEAEDAYRRAGHLGHPTHPGLAQLRLAQGRLDAASAAIRRALEEEHEPGRRARTLAAAVEIALGADDVAAARGAADELARLVEEVGASYLGALSAHVTGAVLLVEGDAGGALSLLRGAWMAWRDLDAPYEAARIRVLLGLACRELGDDEGADLELDAARTTFERLGAAPDLARLEQILGSERPPATAGGLTDREVQVLRLVAAGQSNRAIAEELVISEHTVARHVQNIFGKLEVGSRTAAAAFAYEHDLV